MVIFTKAHVNLLALVISQLEGRRLVVVTGKGGVGKTTVSAALALALARSGKRTLVCEVNTKERVTQLLGKPEVGPTVTSLEENLWAVDVRPHEAMREYALMTLKFESIYSAVFENRLVRYFLRFIPSLQELVLLGKILFHVREKLPDGRPRFDTVIIDAPATGHAITFLSVPQVILDTVPPGALANDAQWMRDLLVDQQNTSAVLVSLPEDMPVNETIELNEALRARVKVRPQLVVLNGFIPERFTEEEERATPAALHDVVHSQRARVKLSQESRTKLESMGVPLITLPRLFSATFGRQAIELLAKRLEEGGA